MAMNADWLSDARKIPDEVMNYLRRIAVNAVEEKHVSPELVAKVFGISRSSIYDWLRRYREKGEVALDSGSAPGALRVITAEMDEWMRRMVLNSTPADHGYDTLLWTCPILVELLERHHGAHVSPASVALHLHHLGLNPQTPCYLKNGLDAAQVEAFLGSKFSRIQFLAKRIGADIGFESEASADGKIRHTWGEVGQPPRLAVIHQPGVDGVLSIVVGEKARRYSLDEKHIDGRRYVEFLEEILRDQERPLIIVANKTSFHISAEVRKFVKAHRAQIRMYFFTLFNRIG